MIILLDETRGNPGRTISACERAPESLRRDCYFGIGKQGSRWWKDEDRVARVCERVPAVHGPACIAGAVESYLDEMWTVDRAMAFCGVVAAEAKSGCYQAIGSRLAIMRTDYPAIESECRRAESGFAAACTKGVALVWLRS